MEIARQFEKRSQQHKRLTALLKRVKDKRDALEEQVLHLIIDEKLPPSFRGKQGASIYTREETWASPLDGDHERLTRVLRSLGSDYAHLLPGSVNSQTLSGVVRKSYNEETGEFDLPPALKEALKITTKQRVVANG